MGIDYSFRLAFGYKLPEGEFERVFGRKIVERYTMEDRWDPKTGQKLDPVRVVTQHEETILVYRDNEYEMVQELVDAIASDIGCICYEEGSYYSNDGMSYIFGPKLPNRVDGYEEGRVTCSGGCYLDDLLEQRDELERIGAKLRDMGLPVEKAFVQIAAVIS